jgi:hypothetical protein
MKSLLKAAAVAAIMGAVISCSGPTEPEDQSFVYPLALGNQWTYQYTQIRIFDGDTPTDTIQYLYHVEVTRIDTILPGILFYEVRESFTDELNDAVEAMRSYVNLPDGMYLYCESRFEPHWMLLKSSSDAQSPGSHTRRSGTLRELAESILYPPCTGEGHETEYFDPVRLVLPYPQEIGYQWVYVDSAEADLYGVDKRIAAWQTVSTPAGTFDCVSIEWLYTNDPPLVDIETLVGSQGLIRRSVTSYDIVVTDSSHPFGTGETYDVYETWELIGFDFN